MDPRIEEAQELVTSLRTKCQLKKEKLLRKQKRFSNNNGNNNDENYKNNYEANNDDHDDVSGTSPTCDNRSSNGRLSRNSGSGTNESAFSSASSEGEDSETNETDRSLSSAASQSSSSGRSSASQCVDSSASTMLPSNESNGENNVKQLNTVCNLTPVNQFARDLAEQVRSRFVESLRADSDDKYEQADLDELNNTLSEAPIDHMEQILSFRLISRFLNFKQIKELHADQERNQEAISKALDEAVAKLKELLLFRHQYRLTNVLDDQFCKEIHMLHGIFPFGCDKNNLPVLYLRARVHRRWSRELDESFRRYVAWQVNLITKSYSGATVKQSIGKNGIEKDGSFGICFDCLNVSYSCVDMDFLGYLVKLLVNYYPTYCRYALCVDLPWLFRSVWKMVRSWLPEDARNTVQLITSKQMLDFIDEDQIPNSIKVNDLAPADKPDNLKHKLPNNIETIRGIEEFAKDLNLSSSEVKQFKAHVEKVRKEYERMGAI
jgi:hypothetical protein